MWGANGREGTRTPHLEGAVSRRAHALSRLGDALPKAIHEDNPDRVKYLLRRILRWLRDHKAEALRHGELYEQIQSQGIGTYLWQNLVQLGLKENLLRDSQCLVYACAVAQSTLLWEPCSFQLALTLLEACNPNNGPLLGIALQTETEMVAIETILALLNEKGISTATVLLIAPLLLSCSPDSALQNMDYHFGRLLSVVDLKVNSRLRHALKYGFAGMFMGRFLDAEVEKEASDVCVIEPSGSDCKPHDIFTLLNKIPENQGRRVFQYTNRQVLNATLFAIAGEWMRKCKTFVALGGDASAIMSMDIVVTYCMRVMKQISASSTPWVLRLNKAKATSRSKGQLARTRTASVLTSELNELHWSSTLLFFNYSVGSKAQVRWFETLAYLEDSAVEVISLEAVRILDRCCDLDDDLVPEVFERVKWFTLGHGRRYVKRTLSRLAPSRLVAVCNFFLTHGEKAMFDVKDLCVDLFGNYLPAYRSDPLFVYLLYDLCLRHHATLARNEIFALFFPGIIKAAIFHASSRGGDLLELFPHLVSRSNLRELLHYIVDMPLVAMALHRHRDLEARQTDLGETAESSHKAELEGIMLRDYSYTKHSSLRNYAAVMKSNLMYFGEGSLVAEAGSWFSPPALQSRRIEEACQLSLTLLPRFVQLARDKGEKGDIKTVFESVFLRCEFLFGPVDFVKSAQISMFNLTAVLLDSFPSLSPMLEPFFVDIVSASPDFGNSKKIELLTHACYLVGRTVQLESAAQGHGLFQSILLLLHSILSNPAGAHLLSRDVHCTRFLLQVVSTLAKFAVQFPEIQLEAQSGLVELYMFSLDNEHLVDPIVPERTNQTVRVLLKAAAIRKHGRRWIGSHRDSVYVKLTT